MVEAKTLFLPKSSWVKHYLLIFLFLFALASYAQTPLADSSLAVVDSSLVQQKSKTTPLQKLLADNKYLNTKSVGVNYAIKLRKAPNENAIFYWLAGLLFFFGLIKTFYNKYFTTLFRVFFNSSLRQSQLTDQLVQAKQPSLFFNILFFLSAGTFVYLAIRHYYGADTSIDWILLAGCVAVFTVIYTGKFLILKFISAVTGYSTQGDSYAFIVFLVNKIVGICLLPINVILAFASRPVATAFINVAIILIGLFLLFRFIRSYGSLQHKMKISGFHFALYILAFEILPIMVIYKAITLYIDKIL